MPNRIYSFHFVLWVANTYNCCISTINDNCHVSAGIIYDLALDVINKKNEAKKMASTALLLRFNIYFVVPFDIFDEFLMTLNDPNVHARKKCLYHLGAEPVLYLKWNDIVSIEVMKFDAPNPEQDHDDL